MLYTNAKIGEGRVCLFNSHTNSVKQITKFTNSFLQYQVATTQNQVNSYVRYFEQFLGFQIFGITDYGKSFEIYDLNAGQISIGPITIRMIDSKHFTGPDPPEWCKYASVVYFKDKLYYLGGKDGKDPRAWKDMNRVDVKRLNESP